MVQVMKAYGEYILEAFIAICLAALLLGGISDENGNRGIFQIIGTHVQVEDQDYTSYTDFKNVYQEESKKPAPEIAYIRGYLCVGINRISDCVKATDYTGNEVPVKVESVKAPDGMELLTSYDPNTSEIDLPKPGIYAVVVSAIDDCNRSTQCTIQIPVNK